jgi:vacuolar protein sorting-associated protein 51
MSTISSPRVSVASSRAHTPTPTSSRRPSLENLNSTSIANLSASSTPTATAGRGASLAYRRNRAALRNYYNLKPANVDSASSNGTILDARNIPRGSEADDVSSPSATIANTELDSPSFDARCYVDQLLVTSSLATVLKAENTLVGDIRTLDGERKALVYDNYSKLIRAVETIGTMRQSMEERGAPLIMTKTLGPAVSFVAETASAIIKDGEEQQQRMKEIKAIADDRRKQAERETVKWVLGAPDRLTTLLNEGKNEEAEKDWVEVDRLLKKWEGVKGVTEVRAACEMAVKRQNGT